MDGLAILLYVLLWAIRSVSIPKGVGRIKVGAKCCIGREALDVNGCLIPRLNFTDPGCNLKHNE